ncbi:MAG: ribosome biogenesis GTP-binding protein YihA/YsxC [Candidatus Auribacterota bacterium]|jgi:GTP-binding protein|nr:ribosome biogenesis GTP-binding protein YihA/YsxC [Candidatus Auribacterota bacterium]
MHIKNVSLQQIAVTPEQFCYDLPQIVFAGRSNVGKSSLLRALVQRKKLVRVGKTPGVTQSINFFRINDAFYFVDLPGYGFAKTPKKIQIHWQDLIEKYFKESINIRTVVFLLDIRHEPTEKDRLFFDWAKSHNLQVMIVATKADKVSNNIATTNRQRIVRQFGIEESKCILFSAMNGTGRNAVLSAIQTALG